MPKGHNKTFGQLVADARAEYEMPDGRRGIEQAPLAARVSKIHPVSGSTVSRIERDEIPVSDELGNALIAVLANSSAKRKEMKEALEDHRDLVKDQKKYSSGSLLNKFLNDHRVVNHVLAEKLGVSHQAVAQWRGGIRLPSDDALQELRKILLKVGVTPEDVNQLTRLHAQDTIRHKPILRYLSDAQREKLIEFIGDLI